MSRVRQHSLDGTQPEVRRRAEWVLRQGSGRIGVSSAYRSYDEQARLRQRYLRGEGPPAARPGTSEHNFGRAVDFDVSPNSRSEYAFMQEIARGGGFWFPIRSEPWHAELDPDRGPLPDDPEEDDMAARAVTRGTDDSTLWAVIGGRRWAIRSPTELHALTDAGLVARGNHVELPPDTFDRIPEA